MRQNVRQCLFFFFLTSLTLTTFTQEPFHIRRVSQNGTAYENSPYDAFFLKSHHNDVFVFHLPILSLTLITRVKRTRRASESDHPYPLPFTFVREVSSINHISFHRHKKAYIKFSRRGVRRFHRGGIRWDAVFKFLKVRPWTPPFLKQWLTQLQAQIAEIIKRASRLWLSKKN